VGSIKLTYSAHINWKDKGDIVVGVLKLVVAVVTAGFLASCAQLTSYDAVQDSEARKAVQNARTASDHLALATYFENAAQEMRTKAEEQKKLLEQFEKEHLYGWQRHNLESHTSALIHKYQRAMRSNMEEAVCHRQLGATAGVSPISC
jgi:hypothetical protein